MEKGTIAGMPDTWPSKRRGISEGQMPQVPMDRVPEVRDALVRMREAIVRLRKSVEVLRDRIEPVLHPPAPCGVEVRQDAPPSCQIANEIEVQAREVETATAAVDDMLERVEI